MAETHRQGGYLVAETASDSTRLRIMRALSAILLAIVVVMLLLGYRSLTMWLSLVVALLNLYVFWWGLRKPNGSS